MRRLQCIALLGGAIAAMTITGCLQVPAYRLPAGYSSTYHRYLQETRQMIYGEIPAVAPPAGDPP